MKIRGVKFKRLWIFDVFLGFEKFDDEMNVEIICV